MPYKPEKFLYLIRNSDPAACMSPHGHRSICNSTRTDMTFGMHEKDICQHTEGISPSAMSRIFKYLPIHGFIKRVKSTCKYFATAYSKETIAAKLTAIPIPF